MARKPRLKDTSNNVVSIDTNPRIIWNDDYSSKIDLAPFYDGKERLSKQDKYSPFCGQPSFIKSIERSLARFSKNKSRLDLMRTYLYTLFKFLADTQRYDFELGDMTSSFLAEHSQWLLKICSVSADAHQAMVGQGNGLIAELSVEYSQLYPQLLQANGEPIKYPTTNKSSNKAVKDISLFANEYIKNVCLDYLNGIYSNSMTTTKTEQGSDHNNLSHVLYCFEDLTYRRLRGEKIEGWSRIPAEFWYSQGFERRPINRYGDIRTNGASISEAVSCLFPTGHEIAACLFLISHDTGWIDTARNINLDADWYATDALDPKNPKSADKVNIYARRPKTDKSNEPPKARLTSGKYGSAFWAINQLVKRTEGLRSFVEDKLKDVTLPQNERVTLLKIATNPCIYLSTKKWEVRLAEAKLVRDFFSAIVEQYVSNDPELTEFERSEILNFTWKDTRDAKALTVLEETNDVVVVQQILEHKSLTTTFEYLRARVLKKKFYEQFSEASGIIYNEVSNGFEINNDVIRARYLTGENLTEEQRNKLSGITASGARCSDIENPPPEIGNLGKGPCLQQSCILCPKAVFIPKEKRALSTFAKYFASLTVKADDLAPERFKNSILEAELTALTIYKTQFFGDRISEFEEIYDARVKLLKEMAEAA